MTESTQTLKLLITCGLKETLKEPGKRWGTCGAMLKRHRNDFVEWRYPTGESQSTDLLDLDKVLHVLDDVYLRIKAGKGP